MTRVFDSPQTEHEVVLVALVTDALSDKPPQKELDIEESIRIWQTEKEHQLELFPHMARE